jgi:hypothetical protein
MKDNSFYSDYPEEWRSLLDQAALQVSKIDLPEKKLLKALLEKARKNSLSPIKFHIRNAPGL